MKQERSLSIETRVISTEGLKDTFYFVRVLFDGKQRLDLGPIGDKDQAHDLATMISQSTREAVAFFLETQQWPVRISA